MRFEQKELNFDVLSVYLKLHARIVSTKINI